MFGFMKKHSEKDREEKERKKREKRDRKDKDVHVKKKEVSRPLTLDELKHLDDVKLNLLQTGEADGEYASGSSESLGSSTRTGGGSREQTPDDAAHTFTSTARVDLGRRGSGGGKVPPGTQPKPKKGILKDKSNYGPEIPNQGVRGNLDDTLTLEENTIANELLTEQQQKQLERQQQLEARQRSVKSIVGSFDVTTDSAAPNVAPNSNGVTASTQQQQQRSGPPKKPVKLSKPKSLQSSNSQQNRSHGAPAIIEPHPDFQQQDSILDVEFTENGLDGYIPLGPPSPAEKIYENIILQLPILAPPRSLKPRVLSLKRLPAGDFGFSLRKGSVLERGLTDNVERKRYVIFAEPGAKHLSSGLLPGDRLLEINGSNVENLSREELIDLIRASGVEVELKVQPIPELSELSLRSGAEGQEVSIAEQSVATGTLKRSGSMRLRAKQGRTEEDLAVDAAWLQAEKIWLVHKGGFAAGRLLRPGEAGGGGGEGEVAEEDRCQVKLEVGGEVLDVEEEDVEKANPPQYDRIEDLANLRYLNESSLLHTLRQRYGSNLIHTYAGPELIVVNPMHPLSIYSEKVINMFRGCKPEDMPPHIYATAQITYRDMFTTRCDQSVVLLGRSGSGKSSSVRHLMHYFAVACGSVNNILSVEKLNAMFTLLDAFGNSRTIMNTSATRYTSLTSLDFDHSGQIASASVQVMMLEKTRITRRPEGEPTFHVFYQMLAGIDSTLRKELQLENLAEPNIFMTPLQRSEDRQRATQAWAKIHHAMGILGIKEDESKALYCVLAAIYHLGVAGTAKGANNKYQFGKPGAAQKAGSVLGVSTEELARAIFSPSVQVRSPVRGGDKSGGDSITGVEALEGFVIGLHTEVFSVLVALINRSLTSNYRSNASILILDNPGFQNPASCGKKTGASFDDLCHNYIQERLQLLKHERVFTSQQDLYSQEGIECEFEPVSSSPQPMVALIDTPSQQSLVRSGTSPSKRDEEQKGLLWILDEEAIYPGSTDQAFTERFFNLNKEKSKSTLLRKGSNRHSIVLNHFQGTNPVTYNTHGWLKACRENPVVKNVTGFLIEAQRQEISAVFSTFRAAGVSTTFSGSIVGMDGTASLRRTSSMRRNFTSGQAGLKRKSVCLQVKFQADSIIDSLRKTKVHFIHCLLPQHNAGLSELRSSQLAPNKAVSSEELMMSVPLMRSQLRGGEVVDSIHIHRQGFPEHMLFPEFRRRYEMLAPLETRQAIAATTDDKLAVDKLLQVLEIEKTAYRSGLSQVFFRAGSLSQLEDAREEKITGTLVKLQALCRGKLGRKKLEKLKLQHTAVLCIQRNVQKFMGIREWSWWKLYTKVRPLLNVHRTEEELHEREYELEQLKLKFDKLEKERNDYKIATERLETKLSEVTADLSEEHMTSNQATEILESEQSERRRLEKELKDITSKFGGLQRKHEAVEMDLYQARMLAAQFEEEDEDETDGDNIYKERYDKLRRQNQFLTQKIEREKEEEIEKYEAQKKHTERKLADAIQECDETRRHMTSWKKKFQRVSQEMGDNKRHLEEQLTRNSDLEKRQRRFDNDLLKISEQLKTEKAAKERLQRERDQVMTEKFSIEQQFKNVKMDYDIQSEKVQRLDKEISDYSFSHKDDQELLSVRRAKNELERKLQDQEEELDDQAGSIQQLEQAKLRLEMSQENLKKQHARELEEKEQELEDMRANTHKKLKTMENQIEEEYESKQALMREKRELDRKLQEVSEMAPARDKDVERRLRKDLKRTKALLHDAQVMLEKQKEAAGSRATVKQLRNQLEDSEYACTAAIKARKSAELELQDLQQQLDELSRTKTDADNRCLSLGRDKSDLLSKLEETDEDMADVMKKYRAVVQQQSTDQILVQDQSRQIEELSGECQGLKERVGELESRVAYLQESTVDRQAVTRMESKVRDVESRFTFEETAKIRAESQVSRLKEQLESAVDERDKLSSDHLKQQESQRRYERQVRDAKEELSESQRKELESSQRKHDIEKKLECVESEYEQSQSDLRLAFKRIADLQAIIEDDMLSEDEDDSDSPLGYSGESDTDDEFMDLVNTRSSTISPRHTLNTSASEDHGDASAC